MKKLLLILSLALFQTSWSQEFSADEKQLIDSLNKLVENPKTHDTILVNAYISLSEILYIQNIDTLEALSSRAKDIARKSLKEKPSRSMKEALARAINNIGFVKQIKGDLADAVIYFQKSLQIQKSINDREGAAYSLNNIAYIYEGEGKVHKALEYYKESLALSIEMDSINSNESTQEGVALALNNIGYLNYKMGNVKEALKYYQQSLKLAEKIDDLESVATAYNNFALVYGHQKDRKNALKYYLLSLDIYKKLGSAGGITNAYTNVASEYDHMSEDLIDEGGEKSKIISLRKKAMEYYSKSLVMSQENQLRKYESIVLSNLASFYNVEADLEWTTPARKDSLRALVLSYSEMSLAIKEEQGNKEGACYSLINLGKIHLRSGNIKKALELGERSMRYAKELNFPASIRNSAEFLSEVYERKGEGLKSLALYKLFIDLRDSLNSEDNQKAAIRQQTQYEYEKQKVLDDAEHEKQLAVEQEAKKKQQILTYATACGLALVAVFLIFVFNRLKVTRKQKGVIELQKAEVEEAHQEIKDSINYAKRIQTAILPPDKLVKEFLSDSFILYKPKDIVAGDFYWMETANDKVLFAAADCTGHGVPGAMVSVVCNNGLNRSVREHGLLEPGKILDMTREIVVQEFEKSEEEVKDGMDIAL